jgi:hypothetical protein
MPPTIHDAPIDKNLRYIHMSASAAQLHPSAVQSIALSGATGFAGTRLQLFPYFRCYHESYMRQRRLAPQPIADIRMPNTYSARVVYAS